MEPAAVWQQQLAALCYVGSESSSLQLQALCVSHCMQNHTKAALGICLQSVMS